MKKVFALAALVAVALTSCVTNEVVTPEGEIAFKAVNYKNTKAVVNGPISGTTYPTTEHFGVYAYHSLTAWSTSYTPNTYMDNVEIWKNGGVWKNHTQSYYWPKTGMLSFVAYSPYEFGTGTVSAPATEGVAFTDFTTTNDFAAQIDLMATDVVKDLAKATPVVPVPVAFKHLLSQVKVAVKPAATNYAANGVTSITIDKVVLGGVNSVADYASVDGAVVANGWSGHATPIVYTYLNAAQTVALDATEGAAVGTAALVIPQTNATRQFTINYTINYAGGAKDVVEGATFNVAADYAWEMGKIYTYTVTIGVGDEITFTPSVSSDWVAVTPDTTISVG